MATKDKQTETNNPLMRESTLPYAAPEFDKIKPEHFEPAIDWAINIAQKNIDTIKSNPEDPSFDNTLAALSFCDEDLSTITSILGVYANSQNTQSIQAVNDTVMPKLTAFSLQVFMDKDLFERIEAVYKQKDNLDLNEEQAMLLEKTYNGFLQNGIALPDKERERYKELSQQLSQQRLKFSNNAVNHSQKLSIFIPQKDKERLEGIPEDIIANYEEAASNDKNISENGYLIAMTPPPIPVFMYAEDRSLREDVFRQYMRLASEGEFDNTPVFHKILELRDEQARMLDFKHHADRVLSTGRRMTNDYRDVVDFLQTNARTYQKAATQFYKELLEFAKQRDGIKTLMLWDRNFYIKKMSEEKIDLSSQAVRPYFELNNVLEGLFEHTRKLYGIDVVEAEDGKYQTLNNNMRVFEVKDCDTGNIRALFYADFYSNPDKRNGAWMGELRSGGLYKGKKHIPIITNDMNLQKPKKGSPTLLDETEVETLWHEFGHACHGMLSDGVFPELSGTSTSWDYVELPSQINECWAFKSDVLATYARHHKTGEIIPQKYIEKFEKLKHFQARWQGLRQTELALMDMTYYTTPPSQITNLKDFEDKTLEPYRVKEIKRLPEVPALATTFNHIVGGYSAGYYVYKWADALVADVRTSFENAEKRGEGCYPAVLCEAFKKEMIAPGGTRMAADMLRNYKTKTGYANTDFDPTAMFKAENIPYEEEKAS